MLKFRYADERITPITIRLKHLRSKAPLTINPYLLKKNCVESIFNGSVPVFI